MSRKSRRNGQSVLVRGPVIAADCAEWMRSRQEQRSQLTIDQLEAALGDAIASVPNPAE